MKTAILALVISLFPLIATADSFEDIFFSVLKKTSAQPDDLEMLRYFIDHEDHATYIYTRVSGPDYVFDGILAAAKLARGRTIPGT